MDASAAGQCGRISLILLKTNLHASPRATAVSDEVQKITTFSTGIAERALNPEETQVATLGLRFARRLIDYLSSEDVAETIAVTGLSPVVSEGRASSSESGP